MQENKIDKLPILNTNEFDSDTETTPNSEINEENQQTQMKEIPSPFPILESLPTISEMKNMKKLKKMKTKIVNGKIKESEETKQALNKIQSEMNSALVSTQKEIQKKPKQITSVKKT